VALNIRQCPLSHWHIYKRNSDTLENAIKKFQGDRYKTKNMTYNWPNQVRRNSTIACPVSYYLLGNDISLTCYWKILYGFTYKALLTFCAAIYALHLCLYGNCTEWKEICAEDLHIVILCSLLKNEYNIL
jgi:hypothetical protein